MAALIRTVELQPEAISWALWPAFVVATPGLELLLLQKQRPAGVVGRIAYGSGPSGAARERSGRPGRRSCREYRWVEQREFLPKCVRAVAALEFAERHKFCPHRDERLKELAGLRDQSFCSM